MAASYHEPMTVRDHLRVLRRRAWAVLAVLLLCVGVAAVWLILTDPTYEARAAVVVTGHGAPRAAILSAAPVLSMLGEPLSALGGSSLATQRQIVESRPSLESAWGLIRERPEVLARLLDEGMTDALFEDLPGILEQLPPPLPPSAWPEEWQGVLETLRVAPVEDSEMLSIRCEAARPEQARDFVNALVLAYLGRSLADERAATRRARRYVQEQISEIEMRLAEAEAGLQQLGESAGTVALDEVARQQTGLMVRLNEQAAVAESTMRAQEALRRELSGRLEALDENVLASTVVRRNPQIADLQQQLARVEAERVGLLEQYTAEALPVREATARVEELRGALESAAAEVLDAREERINPVAQDLARQIIVAEGEALAAQQSLRVLRSASARIESGLTGLPEEQVRLLRVEREIALLERIYMALKQKEQEYEVSERAKAPVSRLVEHAVLPEDPVRPRPLLTLVAALVAGLLLGLLGAGLAEHLDERLHEPEQVAAETGLPVLAVLRRGWAGGDAPDAASRSALSAVLRQARASGSAMPMTALVLAGDENIGPVLELARGLAGAAAEDGRRALVAAGASTGLAEASRGEMTIETQQHAITEVGLGEAAMAGIPAEAIAGALEASEAEMSVVVAPPESGLLELMPMIEAGASVVLVVELGRTTRAAAQSLAGIVRDRQTVTPGIVATGGARSSAQYRRPGTEQSS